MSEDLIWYFEVCIITSIILNIIAIVLEIIHPIRQQFQKQFDYFEIFSGVVFTVGYIPRILTANLIPMYKRPITGNMKYALTPLAIIDLLAFLPFYLPFVGFDLRLLRMFRIFRFFRIFKAGRHIEAMSFITRVY